MGEPAAWPWRCGEIRRSALTARGQTMPLISCVVTQFIGQLVQRPDPELELLSGYRSVVIDFLSVACLDWRKRRTIRTL